MKKRLDKYQEIILLNALERGGLLKASEGVQLPVGATVKSAPSQLSQTAMFFAQAIKERKALEQQIDDYQKMMDGLKFNIEMFDKCREAWGKAE